MELFFMFDMHDSIMSIAALLKTTGHNDIVDYDAYQSGLTIPFSQSYVTLFDIVLIAVCFFFF